MRAWRACARAHVRKIVSVRLGRLHTTVHAGRHAVRWEPEQQSACARALVQSDGSSSSGSMRAAHCCAPLPEIVGHAAGQRGRRRCHGPELGTEVGGRRVQQQRRPVQRRYVEQVHAGAVRRGDGRVGAGAEAGQEGAHQGDALRGRVRLRVVLEHLADLVAREALRGDRARDLRDLRRRGVMVISRACKVGGCV